MTLITETRGQLFSVLLSDNTTLTLQSGESKAIKKELISASLIGAVANKCVSMEDIVPNNTEKKSSNKKNGGAVDNE